MFPHKKENIFGNMPMMNGQLQSFIPPPPKVNKSLLLFFVQQEAASFLPTHTHTRTHTHMHMHTRAHTLIIVVSLQHQLKSGTLHWCTNKVVPVLFIIFVFISFYCFHATRTHHPVSLPAIRKDPLSLGAASLGKKCTIVRIHSLHIS
jgi:hypothetical protein